MHGLQTVASLFALTVCAVAQTVTVTSPWQASYANGGTTVRTIPAGNTYTVGQGDSRTASRPGGFVTESLDVASNRVELSVVASIANLVLVATTASSAGEVLVELPPMRGRVRLTGTSTATVSGGSAVGTIAVDVNDDGSNDATLSLAQPTLDVGIDVDSTTVIPVRISIDTSLTTSTSGAQQLEFALQAIELQQAVLPSGAHLSAEQGTGTAGFDYSGIERLQVRYELSDWSAANVTGPIEIHSVALRGESGLPDPGTIVPGQTICRVYRTDQILFPNPSLNAQLATLLRTQLRSELNVRASTGSTPNTPNIVFEFDQPAVFDPTLPGNTLLFDFGLQPANLMRLESSSAGDAIATFPGQSGPPVAVPAPVVILEFAGAGGHREALPARNEDYGAACGGQPASFYQTFRQGQRFDLSGLTLTPDAYPNPSTYTVTATAPAYDDTLLFPTALNTADDAVATVSIGFPFSFPGGSTTELHACTNGFVYLGTPQLFDPSATPDADDFLTAAPAIAGRLAPLWYDFDCGANAGNSGLHVRTIGTTPNRRCVVSWHDVGLHQSTIQAGSASYRVQCVLHESTGIVEFRYGATPEFCSTIRDRAIAALVGFTPGNLGGAPAVDPKPRDLSVEVPFTTSVEGSAPNIGLSVRSLPIANTSYGGRLFAGQAMQWVVSDVPAATNIAVLILDPLASQPGLSIPGIHTTGCIESTSIVPIIHEFFVQPGPTVLSTPLQMPGGYLPHLVGFELHAQFAVINLSGTGPIVGATSNAMRHTFGLR